MPWKVEKATVTNGEETKEIEVIAKDVNGDPIWVHEKDGTETGVDAKHYFSKIPQLLDEKRKLKDAKTQLEVELSGLKERFEDLDPVKAKEALKTVQNLSDKKLIDSNKVDEVKAQLKEQFDALMAKRDAEHKTIVDRLQDELSTSNSHISKLTISNAFRGSKVLNGPEKRVTVPVEMAEKFWADYFKPTEVDGKLQPVAYMGNKPLYSPQKPGDFATFDEAIMMIIESSPFKENILKGIGQSGGGTENNHETVVVPQNGGINFDNVRFLDELPTPQDRQDYIDAKGLESYRQIVQNTRKKSA